MKKQRWYSRRRSSATPRVVVVGDLPTDYPANVGCMSMVHHLIFAPGAGCVGRPTPSSHAAAMFNPPPPSPSRTKGLEAPRNSLELDVQIGVQMEPAFDELLLLPGRRSMAAAASSEAETPRTPSLVARLMGLPDQLSPSPGLKKPRPAAAMEVKEKKERTRRQPLRSLSCNVAGGEARSLPDTPRASTSSVSARPAAATPSTTWDVVVDRPRLSLQVLDMSPTKKDRDDGYRRRDAMEHAREILRQAKETVTNRKTPASSNKENAASPFVEVVDKLVLVHVQAPSTAPPSLHRAKPSRPPPPPPPPSRSVAPPQAVKCKGPPDGCERFATRIKKPTAGAAAAASPAAPASTSPADHLRNRRRTVSSTSSRPPPPLEHDPEYIYVRSVLERGGFMRAPPPPPSFKGGHSVATPPPPVDPIVFHLLELELATEDDRWRLGPLRHRWNRKLLFHLTQEIILGDDLLLAGPAALLGKVWGRVKAFPPAADCRVVGDIDTLVATDLQAAASVPAVAEEAGDVADDVAERILDALIGECCC